MNNRALRLTAAAFTFALVLVALSIGLFGSGTQAAPPMKGVPAALVAAPPAAPAAQAAQKSERPAVGTWSDIAPFPTVTIEFTPAPTSLKLKRAGGAAYPPNGKVYLLGGRHGTDGEDINLRRIWEYTPGTDTWISKTAALDLGPIGSRWTANMAVAVLTNTSGPRIYAIGGNSIDSVPTNTVRIYDPVADSISVLTTDPWPVGLGRVPGGWSVYDNKLYIFGGFTSIGAGAVFNETWVFDPMAAAGARWSQLATGNLSLARGYIAGATLDGKIYAVGGDTWNSSSRTLIPQAIVERLDPTLPSPSWVPVASLPSPRGDLGAWAYDTGTGYEISGRVVVAGGVFPVPDGKAFSYDPVTNSWSPFPDLVHATRNYGTAQLDGYLYALGGYDYSANIPNGANFSQRYDATGPQPTATNTPVTSPTATGTPFNQNYTICTLTGGVIDPGTTLVPGSSCDDCQVIIPLPFPYTLYNETFNSARLSSNGVIGFTVTEVGPAVQCLPDLAANDAIFGYWEDLVLTGAGNGIYTSTVGVAPNRIFNIEYRGARSSRIGSAPVNFEVRLYEGQTRYDVIYGAVAANGNTATVGVQKDNGTQLFAQYSCQTSALRRDRDSSSRRR
jgi:hypothetical protein